MDDTRLLLIESGAGNWITNGVYSNGEIIMLPGNTSMTLAHSA